MLSMMIKLKLKFALRPLLASAIAVLLAACQPAYFKVLNVAARSGRLFLNFGDDWRTDFTAVVPKNLLTAAPGEAEKLQSLKGHTIRVRGWIERRYGPSIEIFSLSDLEDLTAPGGVTAP